MSAEEFLDARKGILENAGYTLLTDSEGNILYSQGDENALQLAAYKSRDALRINGKQYVVFEDVTDWMGLHLYVGIRKRADTKQQ